MTLKRHAAIILGGGIVLESKYERKKAPLCNGEIIILISTYHLKMLESLVTVLGQIWNDLQLLIGVFEKQEDEACH